MRRQLVHIRDEDIWALSNQVCLIFGSPIKTKKNVYNLIDAIVEKTPKDIISFNTLRRFFKLIPSKHNPNIETLNILSRFCGYPSWIDFTFVVNNNSENLIGHSIIKVMRNQYSSVEVGRTINKFGRSNNLYHWLSAVFLFFNENEKIDLVNLSLQKVYSPQSEQTDLGYAQYFWLQNLGCWLYQMSSLKFRKIIVQISNLKVIADFCVSYNLSDSNYDILLEYTKPLFKSCQDQTFYLSITIFREYLRSGSFTKKQRTIIQNWEAYANLMDIKPFSRMRALQIISNQNNDCISELIVSDLEYFEKNNFARESFVFYLVEIMRALCYVGQTGEVIKIFEKSSTKYVGYIGFWTSIHRNTLFLYLSWAYALRANEDKSVEYYKLFDQSLIENFQEELLTRDYKIVGQLIESKFGA